VDLKIIGNAECEAVYGDVINDSKICVDTAGGDTSTCFVSNAFKINYAPLQDARNSITNKILALSNYEIIKQ
jgi:hypothetical protein